MILALFIGLVGLACLYGEFFLPGGILAVVAVCILIGSIIVFSFSGSEPFWIFCYGLFLLICSILVCKLALKNIRRSKDSFFLKQDQEGFVSSSLEQELLRKEGTVATELKPAGHVRIEGKVYQALSQGEFLEKGSIIEVVSIRGSHLIVKRKK